MGLSHGTHLLSVILITVVASSIAPGVTLRNPLDEKTKQQYLDYYKDTVDGLELMRSKNGLISDNMELTSNGNPDCKIISVSHYTTPSNIGLDILVQLGELQFPELADRAKKI